MSRVRGWVRRVALSVLAGGGLTAGLGGPLTGPAGAAESQGGSSGAKTLDSAEATTTSLSTAQPESPSSTTTTTTTTATTTTETTVESTTPPPAAEAPAAAPPAPSTTPGPSAPKKPAAPVPAPPVVSVQRDQLTTGRKPAGPGERTSSKQLSSTKPAATKSGSKTKSAKNEAAAQGPSNIALPPQLVAAESQTLAALLGGSNVTIEALSYFRIPLFLLPVYQAAAIQYGVPWEVLAAINEVETDYGNDLSVSSAGAVGWMQFMPSTWLQYGVDVDEAGYADPYNPVDAIFAAARYLHAAGASQNLSGAIFAYNHSQAYVESVLLRAKLAADYPRPVVATLTGLAEGVLPVAGAHVVPGSLSPVPGAQAGGAGSSSATAGAQAQSPGSYLPPAPSASAAKATDAASAPQQLITLTGASHAPVVAVQDGRVVRLGRDRQLGLYLMLRDVYGDLFTYAGLGSVAPTYRSSLPSSSGGVPDAALAGAAGAHDKAPTSAASEGGHPPLTLHVQAPKSSAGPAQGAASAIESGAPAGKVRLFAHPDNPYAREARAKAAVRAAEAKDGMLPLRTGAVVPQGAVLGHLGDGSGSEAQLRFAIRPAGDVGTIDPTPILQSWRQLDAALHPQGARSEAGLLGATAADVFLLSGAELRRAVLSDPGVRLDACARQDVAAGLVDSRLLAVLAFLSRSGLKPTVGSLACEVPGRSARALASSASSIVSLAVERINGIAIAGHQGPGTITDLAIRTLLTLQGRFAPARIVSLMEYPGARSTQADRARWNQIQIGFDRVRPSVRLSAAATATAAHSAAAGKTAPAPVVLSGGLSSFQWSQLIDRIGSLPQPTVSRKRSSAAIRDQSPPQPRSLP